MIMMIMKMRVDDGGDDDEGDDDYHDGRLGR